MDIKLTQTRRRWMRISLINGFPAASASNVVSSAISGVTLNLTAATAPATPTTLTVSPDTSAVRKPRSATFVTALNGVISSIQSLTSYDPSTQTAGPLNGNATLQVVPKSAGEDSRRCQQRQSGGVQLARPILGITANTDGSYGSDTTKLGNVAELPASRR